MFAIDNSDFGFDSGCHEFGADFDSAFAEAHTITDDDRMRKHHTPIVPSTVKQVLKVSCENTDQMVCVVGLVSRIEDTPLALRIWIEDGTAGELQVDYWSDSPAHHCDKAIHRARYVRVVGKVHAPASGAPKVSASHVRHVVSANEITFHLTQCMHAHVDCSFAA